MTGPPVWAKYAPNKCKKLDAHQKDTTQRERLETL